MKLLIRTGQLAFVFSCILVTMTGCSSGTSSSGSNSAADANAYSGKTLADWREQFDEIITLLTLDESDQDRLKQIFETHSKTLQEWYARHGQDLAEAEKKMFDAAKEKRLSEFRKYKAQASSLRDEGMKLHDRFDEAVEQSLPQQKRFEWYAHRNVQRLTRHIESLALSDDQMERLKQQALSAVLESESERSPEQAGYAKLLSWFKSRLLTAEQKTKFEGLLKKKPLSFVYSRHRISRMKSSK